MSISECLLANGQLFSKIILESIRSKTEVCTVQSVLNCIALYSEWYDIGSNLGLPPVELDKISQQCRGSDPMPHLVELWQRWDPNGLSWEKLYQALKIIAEMRARRGSGPFTENGRQHRVLHTQQSLPMTPEEPVPMDSTEPVTGSNNIINYHH